MSADIGKSVRSRLSSRSAVTNICKNRIFADVRDQDTDLPAVTVQVTSNNAEEDLTGTNRIFQSTVVVVAYAADRDKANELAEQIRDDALTADLRGRIEGMDWQEVTLIGGPNEIVEEPEDGSDNWIRITEQQFVIWNSAV